MDGEECAAETAYPQEKGQEDAAIFPAGRRGDSRAQTIQTRAREHPKMRPVKARAGAIPLAQFAICVQHRKARCDVCVKNQTADLMHCYALLRQRWATYPLRSVHSAPALKMRELRAGQEILGHIGSATDDVGRPSAEEQEG